MRSESHAILTVVGEGVVVVVVLVVLVVVLVVLVELVVF